MSFQLNFNKDHLISKLCEAKDRASAILRQLDNCEVKLNIISSTNQTEHDSKMPHKNMVRSRSRSKCKTSCSHSHERVIFYKEKPRYISDWDDDESDDDSVCSCDDNCHSTRGRSPFPVYIDGHNASQQNIQIQGGGARDIHKKYRGRSRHRPRDIVVVGDDGCKCGRSRGHGCHCHPGYITFPPVSRPLQNYHMILNDDGKVDLYEREKLNRHIFDQFKAIEKAQKEEKEAAKKVQNDAVDLFNKLQGQQCPPRFGCGGGCGLWSCGCNGLGGSYGSSRSAEAIRSELAKLKANKQQLYSEALLEGQRRARQNEIEVALDGVEMMCSGALQDTDSRDDLKSRGARKTTKGMLMKPKVHFLVEEAEGISGRVEEVDDTDGEERRGEHCCSGCS
ncbi:hypothetical protein LTR05_007133 [Lithohypha guttulata]|uniref:Uncharacterized protein n=1 Tax=Lithohypha guttulata TaxID=1690604 RepID=A0AAN7SUP6_9EURO|nr:hypothetical protein LTR05_007133 [Lithohypha guttulata]